MVGRGADTQPSLSGPKPGLLEQGGCGSASGIPGSQKSVSGLGPEAESLASRLRSLEPLEAVGDSGCSWAKEVTQSDSLITRGHQMAGQRALPALRSVRVGPIREIA